MNENKTPIRFPKIRETMAIAVAERHTADEAFRNSFDRDPKTTMLQHFDIAPEEWPAALELTVLRNDDRHVHVAVPVPTPPSDVEISDDALENISGGWVLPGQEPPTPTARGIMDFWSFTFTGRPTTGW